jgi:hypothetical protein
VNTIKGGNVTTSTKTKAKIPNVMKQFESSLAVAYSDKVKRQFKSTTSKVLTLKLANRNAGEQIDRANTKEPKDCSLNCLAIIINNNQLLPASRILAIRVSKEFLAKDLATLVHKSYIVFGL